MDARIVDSPLYSLHMSTQILHVSLHMDTSHEPTHDGLHIAYSMEILVLPAGKIVIRPLRLGN
jgi:hypothetical protein